MSLARRSFRQYLWTVRRLHASRAAISLTVRPVSRRRIASEAGSCERYGAGFAATSSANARAPWASLRHWTTWCAAANPRWSTRRAGRRSMPRRSLAAAKTGRATSSLRSPTCSPLPRQRVSHQCASGCSRVCVDKGPSSHIRHVGTVTSAMM